MTIKIEISKDIEVLCEQFKITPKDLLEQFMDDLCSRPGNGGSDERRMAKEYFLRGSIASQISYEDGQLMMDFFEGLYQKHYPSVSNKTHIEDRSEDLYKFKFLIEE